MDSEMTFADRVFKAQVQKSIRDATAAYRASNYREVNKIAMYELTNARDSYRDVVNAARGFQGIHTGLMQWSIRIQMQLMAPIIPHSAEHAWTEILRQCGSIFTATWPTVSDSEIDESVLAAHDFVQQTVAEMRKALHAEMNPKKKPAQPPAQPTTAEIFVAAEYPAWQEQVMAVVSQHYHPETNSFSADSELVAAVSAISAAAGATGKKLQKTLIAFIMDLKKRVLADRSLRCVQESRNTPFDQMAVLEDNLQYITKSLGLTSISAVPHKDAAGVADEESPRAKKAEAAIPGQPTFSFSA